MDKQFLRILMLSALLPAGVALAKAIEHDRAPLDVMGKVLVSRLSYAAPAGSTLQQASENRRFAAAVAAEHDVAGRRGRR